MNKFFYIALRVAISVILIQTLYFKFTAHPDSVFIFTQVGLEPWGRIGIGVLELLAGIMLLIPRSAWAGALLTFGLMIGAITMHLSLLGIEVKDDGGQLFMMAIGVFIASAVVLWQERRHLPLIG